MTNRNYTDFSDAESNTFEVLPDGTEVKVILHVQAGDPGIADGCIKVSPRTGAHMLNVEATVIEGKYAKRKLFFGFYMGADSELTEGQQTAVDMSRARLRAICEAARGFAPTDETAGAIAARRLKSLRDIDGMECSVILSVEKGKDGYQDKNAIKRVVAHGKERSEEADPRAVNRAVKQATAAASKKGW